MDQTYQWRPEILFPNTKEGNIRIAELRAKTGVQVRDLREKMLIELWAISYPQDYFAKRKNILEGQIDLVSVSDSPDVWVWYPWKNTLLRILQESDLLKIRTSRNKHLISATEQEKFRGLHIGIAGLSVGYSIALSVVLEGGGKHLSLADHDTLDLSNLNRLPLGVDEVGLPKAVIVARRLYELDPYLDIVLFPDGLNDKTVVDFTSNLDVIVDEVDDWTIKFLLRQEAKKRQIPLFMATDNEETGMIDVERYDIDSNVEPFLSRISLREFETFSTLNKRESGNLVAAYVGEDYTTDRMRASLQAIGKELISWPQIGGTALLNGGAVSYALRTLITNHDQLRSGRYAISLPKIFGIS